MDNRLIFLYYDKSLNMRGRRRVDQPAVGRAGSKPVGDEAGVKRPAELRGDGEPVTGRKQLSLSHQEKPLVSAA